MTMTDLEDDDQLLARLTGLARRIDPVPSEVVAAATGSFAWRTIDLELAELVYDSAEEPDLVGVRSEGGGRHLTFATDTVTVEMEIGEAGGVVGQLVPPQPAAIEIRHRSSTTALVADHLGRFQGPGVPSGPMSLRCRPDSGRGAIATDWLVI